MHKNQKDLFISIAHFLHCALGDEYEIVLHEFDGTNHKILYLANGHISGRTDKDYTIQSLDEILEGSKISGNNFYINSKGMVYNNKVIKHSSFFIKDDKNDLQGILCVNFNGSKYVNLAKKILQLTNMDNASIENSSLHSYDFKTNMVSDLVSNIANAIIDEAVQFSDIPVDMLPQEEKIEIIRTLNDKEVFLMKGSINDVADRLGVSKATIYRYLQIINEDEKNK